MPAGCVIADRCLLPLPSVARTDSLAVQGFLDLEQLGDLPRPLTPILS